MAEEPGRIAVTSVPLPADQSWFWSSEWQARIAEAEAGRIVGNSTVYVDERDFVDVLDSEADQSD